MTKKMIKHLTVRRPLTRTSERTVHGAKSKVAAAPDRRWTQTFKVGYIEQAFRRTCVRESLKHGEANAAFLQRTDAKLTQAGKANTHHKFTPMDSPIPPMQSVHDAAKDYDESAFMAKWQAARSGGKEA